MLDRFARFRQQHRELQKLAADLVRELYDGTFPDDIMPTLRARARFCGQLRVHAAMEDEALYPWLRGHPDAELRDIGQRLADELGPIYQTFFAYDESWTPDEVRRDPAAFALATSEVLQMLHERMVHENRTIYDRVVPRPPR